MDPRRQSRESRVDIASEISRGGRENELFQLGTALCLVLLSAAAASARSFPPRYYSYTTNYGPGTCLRGGSAPGAIATWMSV